MLLGKIQNTLFTCLNHGVAFNKNSKASLLLLENIFVREFSG